MRSKSKIFRLTELQSEQLENHLKQESISLTDFIHSLIQRELMKNFVTVKRPHDQEGPLRVKVKTVIELVKRYQKTDPALLLELARIGNNLNQLARALNIIKNAALQEQKMLDIFACFQVLKGIQNDLEQIYPALPKIYRQPNERVEKQLSSLQLAEGDESAY